MDTFNTKSLALQAQKKLLSKMASKAVVAVLVDDTSSEVLDELYRATREFTRSRKEAQKMLKNLVKVALKLGLLLRGDQLGGEELALLRRFRHRANHVFGHLADCDFLAALYGPAEPYRSHLRRICEGLGRMLDEGSL
ncbi:Tumor necrosis factor alpha-induced protein 8-like protein 1 [Macaca mulatta]|uniref:Tumor necrosis factor alpha-induced protein 8-like protein 1 n=1 Tax=Macaca mulatta TaxID=9544 RepID=G7NMH6_MACMU|nr:Tumor necrosis factor alpha-induced protein 8-like protein 1 [Macaca mulatta]